MCCCVFDNSHFLQSVVCLFIYKECQSLVLAPTRELAQQIVKVITSLGDFMQIAIHACVGGTAVRDDIRTLQEGVHVVVGTPGRVYDMIQRYNNLRLFFFSVI